MIVLQYKPISEAYERGDYTKPGGYKAYADAMQVLEKEYRNTKGKGTQVEFLSCKARLMLSQAIYLLLLLDSAISIYRNVYVYMYGQN